MKGGREGSSVTPKEAEDTDDNNDAAAAAAAARWKVRSVWRDLLGRQCESQATDTTLRKVALRVATKEEAFLLALVACCLLLLLEAWG